MGLFDDKLINFHLEYIGLTQNNTLIIRLILVLEDDTKIAIYNHPCYHMVLLLNLQHKMPPVLLNDINEKNYSILRFQYRYR